MTAPTLPTSDPGLDLALPRWTWTAWLIHSRQQTAAPRPHLPLSVEAAVEARRLERLRRDLVPA